MFDRIFFIRCSFLTIISFIYLHRVKIPRAELYSHNSDNNSALVDIAIKGSTIFAALTELTQTLETTPFNVLTHSVYRVDKEIAVPRNDKSKLQPSNVYTTHDAL